MEEVKTLKAEREVTEKTLRDPVADIVPKFMSALKDLGDVDEESISEAHLRTEYSRLQQEVSGVMNATATSFLSSIDDITCTSIITCI